MCISDWIQLGSLIVATIGLYFLVRYVQYTRTIAQQSVRQSEALSKPAIIALDPGSVDKAPQIKNIGNGPALEIRWSMTHSINHGILSYLEPNESISLPLESMKSVYEAGLKSGNEAASIHFTYKSISGKEYASSNDYDFKNSIFKTTFEG